MLRRFWIAKELLRHFGFSWVLRRVIYSIKVRTGWLKRKMPLAEWTETPLNTCLIEPALAEPAAYVAHRRKLAERFLFQAKQFCEFRPLFKRWDKAECSPVDEAANIIEGELRYFECCSAKTGFPPDWHLNQFTGLSAPKDVHWSRLGDFDFGDIKVLWEPSRFGFVFTLARAYARTGDDHLAEAFWRSVEDWRDNNPPQYGVNWKCGQEASFRVMAWCFGLHAFLDAPATTSKRLVMLAEMLVVHGRRIETNIGYALQQSNNHGISEAVGLWTLGVLFPEFTDAAKWRELGAKLLAKQVKGLIYDDGSFSQHSVNYHRVMLHDFLWALKVGDSAGEQLPDVVSERVQLAGKWLKAMIIGRNGATPNYGANDGALIFPLTNCDYTDFRPVVQALEMVISNRAAFPSGPWDEEALWFGGIDLLKLPRPKNVIPKQELAATEGGYYTMRGDSSAVFIRCPERFRHRPSQADLLHVDLWWRGENVALDAGTFSYNAPEPWNNALVHTRIHNTVSVAGRDQSEHVGRFMFLPWPTGCVRHREDSQSGKLSYWEGEHCGYLRLRPSAQHRRAVARLGEECWVVIDKVVTSGAHQWEVNWLFPDVPHAMLSDAGIEHGLTLEMAAGGYQARWFAPHSDLRVDLVRVDPLTTRGWCSRYYLKKEPALSLRLSVRSGSSTIFTVFAPADIEVSMSTDRLLLCRQHWSAELKVATDYSAANLLVKSLKYVDGAEFEKLALYT